jgi:polysaccharide pyruvyl transferase WcaK-like protein
MKNFKNFIRGPLNEDVDPDLKRNIDALEKLIDKVERLTAPNSLLTRQVKREKGDVSILKNINKKAREFEMDLGHLHISVDND